MSHITPHTGIHVHMYLHHFIVLFLYVHVHVFTWKPPDLHMYCTYRDQVDLCCCSATVAFCSLVDYCGSIGSDDWYEW